VARLQSNRDALVVTLLSKKSRALTINYNFWPSGKRSIITTIYLEFTQ